MSHTPNDPNNHDATWQVSYLKNEKGLTFDLISEADAVEFLRDMTFFFKVKSFAKNYEKRFSEGPEQGKYINLDFGHLVELSRLDVYVRSAALSLSLDIEHYLKVRINRSAMANNIDPCALTENYLEYLAQVIRADVSRTCELRQPQIQIQAAIHTLEGVNTTASSDEVADKVNRAIGCLEELTEGKKPNFVFDSLTGEWGVRHPAQPQL